jgi:hypothetical protein
MVSGQAAAAVVISGVQVVSAVASVWGKPRQQVVSDGSAEERSAFIFFSLSTLFLAATAVLHRWMVRTPVYQRVAAALEKQPKELPSRVDREEILGLMAPHVGNIKNDTSEALRVAKQNASYEVAVAYVFGITLVSVSSIHLFHHFNERTTGCLPTHNNFSAADQPVDSPIGIHCGSFFGIQPCRLSRSPCLFIPQIHYMVRTTTISNICGKDAVHTPFLDV